MQPSLSRATDEVPEFRTIDGSRRRLRLHDPVADIAAELRPYMAKDLEAGADVLRSSRLWLKELRRQCACKVEGIGCRIVKTSYGLEHSSNQRPCNNTVKHEVHDKCGFASRRFLTRVGFFAKTVNYGSTENAGNDLTVGVPKVVDRMAEPFVRQIIPLYEAREQEREARRLQAALSPLRGRRLSNLSLERFRTSSKYQDRPAAADIAFCVAAFANGMSKDRIECALEDEYLSRDLSPSKRASCIRRTMTKARGWATR